MGDACSWKRLLNYNSQSSVWHFMWLSHSPGPFPSVSQSFLLTASVALRLVEILEKRKATECCWRTGSSLTEMKAGMKGEEGGHGTGQREGGRTDCLPHGAKWNSLTHCVPSLPPVMCGWVQLRCYLGRVGNHAPWCPWKSPLRMDCLQCHTASSPREALTPLLTL